MAEVAKIVMWVAVCLVALFVLIAIFRLTGKSDREVTWEGLGSKLRLKKAQPAPLLSQALTSDAAAAGTDQAGNPPPLPFQNSHDDISFWSASTVQELEAAWQAFKASDAFDGKDEFWTTQYVAKKKALGVKGASEELRLLWETNAKWVWPLVVLSDEARAASDWEAARKWLTIARERNSEDAASAVATRLVALAYESAGLDHAISVSLELCDQAAVDVRRAIFDTIATEMKGVKDGLAEQIIKEFALREGEASGHSQFALAHSYGETADTSVMALRHYAKLSEKPDADVNVDNNMAILYEQFGKRALAISCYEISVANGNALAACNLALDLLEGGYLARAESILEPFTDFTGIEGRKAAVDAKLAEVRLALKADRAAVRDLTLKPFQQWQQFIIAAKAHFEAGDATVPQGSFRSSDGELNVMISDDNASVSLNIEGTQLAGAGMRRGPFWELVLLKPSQSILGGSHRRAILAATGADMISCVALPEYGNLVDIEIKQAKRVEVVSLAHRASETV